MSEKLKSLILNDQIFFSILVLLVGVGSFGLGRASISGEKALTTGMEQISASIGSQGLQNSSLTSEPVDTSIQSDSASNLDNLSLVASKGGTKYHLVTCPGAKQIKDTNKINFSSINEAEAAGYKPAANCPGLQ